MIYAAVAAAVVLTLLSVAYLVALVHPRTSGYARSVWRVVVLLGWLLGGVVSVLLLGSRFKPRRREGPPPQPVTPDRRSAGEALAAEAARRVEAGRRAEAEAADGLAPLRELELRLRVAVGLDEEGGS